MISSLTAYWWLAQRSAWHGWRLVAFRSRINNQYGWLLTTFSVCLKGPYLGNPSVLGKPTDGDPRPLGQG